jgi:two-component system, OmpR family, phosphate regulon response regulator OmpR
MTIIMETPYLLIVDDDPGIRELLSDYLSGQGFEVAGAADAKEMDAAIDRRRPDLVVLDLMLPGEDGLSIARRLKGGSKLPIIMLSARGEDIDRIVGLEVGADDYLPKPFNPRELLARIRAVLRRGSEDDAGTKESGRIAQFGPYKLDFDAHILSRDGEEIALTAAEYSLLEVFVEHPNRVLSRDQLMDMLKGFERDPFDRSIDVRVTRVRRKIEDDPANPVYIRTVWGQGYLFAPKGKGG